MEEGPNSPSVGVDRAHPCLPQRVTECIRPVRAIAACEQPSQAQASATDDRGNCEWEEAMVIISSVFLAGVQLGPKSTYVTALVDMMT